MTSLSDDPGREPRDVAQLLHKAIKQLPDHEQQAVFEYFLQAGIATGSPAGQLVHARIQAMDMSRTIATGKSAGSGRQLIPVRLSDVQHQRLKSWCAEHDFHMSVVIRGLIDRFLDDWDDRSRRT